MSTPVFKLSLQEAAYNQAMLVTHEKNTKNEYLFGVWKWGHTFIRLENADKCVYKFLYSIFAKIGLIKTEKSDKQFFQALKDATQIKAKPLSEVYLTEADKTITQLRDEKLAISSKAKEDQGTLVSQLSTVAGQRDRLQSDLSKVRGELAAANDQRERAETTLAALRTTHAATESEKQAALAEKGDLEGQLNATGEELSRTKEKLATFEEQNKTLAASIASVTRTSDEALGPLNRENASLKDTKRELEEQLRQARQAETEQRALFEAQVEESLLKETELKSTKKELATVREELEAARTSKAELEKLRAEHTEVKKQLVELVAVRGQLLEAQQALLTLGQTSAGLPLPSEGSPKEGRKKTS